VADQNPIDTDLSDTETRTGRTRRGPSAALLLAGLLAVLVSVWAFIGPAAWPTHSGVPLGWIVVGAAIVVGCGLVLSPRRRR
jgi:fatty acid desaturase